MNIVLITSKSFYYCINIDIQQLIYQNIMIEDQVENLRNQEKEIKKYLSTIPYENLLQIKKNTSAPKNSKIDTPKNKIKKIQQKQQDDQFQEVKEISAKGKPKRKIIFESRRKNAIDPRFENYSGYLNSDLAYKSYSFIKDMQKKQQQVLKKEMHNKKISQNQRQILVQRYSEVTNNLKSNQRKNIQKQVIRSEKQRLNKQIGNNQGVFYKTKKIMKDQILKKQWESMGEKNIKKAISFKKKQIERRLQNKRPSQRRF